MNQKWDSPRRVQDLVSEFQAAGIRRGSNLIIHSSLKKLGPLEKGAETLADAVLEVLGPEGNLMVPTFTYSLPTWTSEPFDHSKSRSRTGGFTEYLRSRAGAVRSFHPTHSVAVIGPRAGEIIANHMHATPIGLESPFGRMFKLDASILMLGTFQDTNSSLHYCEVAARVPYLDVCFTNGQTYELAWFVNEKGQVEYTQLFEMPGCSRGFRKIEPHLRERGVLQDVKIAEAECQLLNLRSLVAAAGEILRREPSLILCDTPNCMICPKRKLAVRHGASSTSV